MKVSIYSKVSIILVFTVFFFNVRAQEKKSSDAAKKGFSFGAIPVFSFDSDIGLKTGIAVNIYHFGSGERYPKYDHSLFLKWYRTTKNSNLSQIVYDSDKLIPNIRLTSEFSYISDKSLDFYGFNGYKSYFNPLFIDASSQNNMYISQVYYKHERRLFRIKSDFQSSINQSRFKWLLGFSYFNIKIQSIDIDNLNESKTSEFIIPDTANLYDKYVDWGIIKEEEKNGGITSYIKGGLIYDSRDTECNCNTGTWTEAIILYAPTFKGTQSGFGKLLFTHRQYFPIKFNRLTFAYRLSYQTKLWGDIPFYALPFFIDSRRTEDGMGGAKNLRGVLRNRVVSDGFLSGTVELRWKFWTLKAFNQDFYVCLNGFSDAVTVTDEYKFSTESVKEGYGFSQEENLRSLNYSDNKIHMTYGTGIYVIMNDNFVMSADYGRALSKQDGKSGLYVGFDFIF